MRLLLDDFVSVGQVLEEMMHPMGRRGSEKENETGNNSQGANRAKIIVDLFHSRRCDLILHTCVTEKRRLS